MDHSLIEDLFTHPAVIETRQHMHHHVAKLDHLMRSARYANKIARWLRADVRTCVRAALLHDLDSRLGSWSTHGAIAARVAERLGETEAVCSAITTHMYPLGPAPSSREGWVLVVADKMASVHDAVDFVLGLLTGRSVLRRMRLARVDPFLA